MKKVTVCAGFVALAALALPSQGEESGPPSRHEEPGLADMCRYRASHPPPPPPPRVPPPEAFAACSGKTMGAPCAMSLPHGEAVRGRCVDSAHVPKGAREEIPREGKSPAAETSTERGLWCRPERMPPPPPHAPRGDKCPMERHE